MNYNAKSKSVYIYDNLIKNNLFQKQLKSSTLWSCNVRSKKLRCSATVSQAGENYVRGKNLHVHPADHSLLSKTKIKTQVRFFN